MMTRLLGAVLLLAASACAAPPDWEQLLADRLPFYGHRNWIVIADSAYPAQARDGIETIVVNVDQVRVLRHVLATLDVSIHVRPILFLDKELGFIDENMVPGIGPYRAKVEDFARNREVHSLPHEQIIRKLDEAGQTFKILIIKTTMTMPYTSVFLQLDCAYWGPEAEQKLRAAMSGK